MRRFTLCWFLLASGVIAPLAVAAGTSVGVTITVGNAPPPPAIIFRHEPRVLLVPGSTVYVMKEDCDYDLFRYGLYWYAFNEGCWYRARTHRGPFAAVSVRYVPSAVVNVPSRYWRHAHGDPLGKMKKRGDYVAMKEEPERGHKH